MMTLICILLALILLALAPVLIPVILGVVVCGGLLFAFLYVLLLL